MISFWNTKGKKVKHVAVGLMALPDPWTSNCDPNQPLMLRALECALSCFYHVHQVNEGEGSDTHLCVFVSLCHEALTLLSLYKRKVVLLVQTKIKEPQSHNMIILLKCWSNFISPRSPCSQYFLVESFLGSQSEIEYSKINNFKVQRTTFCFWNTGWSQKSLCLIFYEEKLQYLAA